MHHGKKTAAIAPAVTPITLGVNAAFASSFLSILGLKRRSKQALKLRGE